MKFSLTILVEHLYPIVLLIVSIVGIVHYKKLTYPFKILVFSAISSFLIAITSTILVALTKTNAPVIHIEAVTGYVFYAFVYYCFFTNKFIKAAIITSIIIVPAFAIVNAIVLQPFLTTFPSNVTIQTYSILTVLSLLLFRRMLLIPSKKPLLEQGVFWYNSAVLFWSTTQFILDGLSNYFVKYFSHSFFSYLFYLWYGILYLFAALIALALLKASKETSKAASPVNEQGRLV